jgi:hypothetical protein
MASHIPFVNTKEDCRILNKYYMDSDILRVSIEKIEDIKANLPKGIPLWIDAGVDGCEHHLRNQQESIPSYLNVYSGSDMFANSAELIKPNKASVRRFVHALMDDCLKLKPSLITVPQLAMVDGTMRNKINMELAQSTNEWKVNSRFRGKLVFPIVFTHRDQLHGRTKWKPRVDSALKWYNIAGADYIWVVDSSLSDQMGTGTFRDRFPSLIDFHKYIRLYFPKGTKVIAGPYWGMNLILWARGLCDYPAIGLGNAYTYYIPGGRLHKGKTRIAIPPLRRWAVVSPELRTWLDKSLRIINVEDIAYIELYELKKRYDSLSFQPAARNQVARFYKKWFNKIERTPRAGRSLALYQDLSSAYVIGKQLPILPPSGGTARRPERVAEYLMLNCL